MRITISTKWVLTASLALNVFLATVLVVVYSPHRPPLPDVARIAERIAETLPAADAAILREIVALRAPEIDLSNHVARSVPDRVRAELGKEEFDPNALRPLFAEFAASHQRMDEALAGLVIEAATRMSPEGRAALARWRPPPPPPGFGGNPPPPPPGFEGNPPPPPPPGG
ncbi:periplasmic heavy metal sensor [Magnetospirillum fulvum]|uniref:Heavy-metal resistance n=1 Tax=Magnetospirillum fulvum TaxID=1082 RepID=A0A1H6IXV0_MAGFU|nr:periplasmic heavy metal sensor [Magnetospirillum fulvum]SEH54492.1 Heavy-metal resistance [Magnetospirillum fulvum]